MKRVTLALVLAAALSCMFAPYAAAAKPVATPPVATGISAYNGSPGTLVTIYGLDFGPQKKDSIVWFNGIRAHFTSWTDTAVTFKVPSGVDGGYVGIQNDAGCSNGFYFVPFDAPAVSSVSHAEQAVGADVTITGSTFESAQGDGWVSFAGTPGVVRSWSEGEIVVTVPPGASAGYVGVVQHGISSNGVLFTPYYQPMVQSVSSSYALVGETVTLVGTDFGADPGTVVIGGSEIEPSSWSDGAVSFVVPADTGSGYVGIVRDGRTSNGFWLTTAPRVTSVSAWWAPPGGQVTVYGVGFGDAADGRYDLLLGGQEVPADSWSADSVTFTVPSGIGSGYIGFSNADRSETSNGMWLLVLKNAVITGVSSQDVDPGATITLTGTDFGEPGPDSTLRLGDVVLAVSSWTDTEIVATVPEYPIYGYLGVWKSGVASNGVLLNVTSAPADSPNESPPPAGNP